MTIIIFALTSFCSIAKGRTCFSADQQAHCIPSYIQPASIFHEERNTKILFPKSIWFHLSLRHAWMVINWSWQSQCHYLTFFGHGVKYCDASKKVFHTALISFLLWFSRFKTTPETVTGRNNWLKKWGRKEPQNKFFFWTLYLTQFWRENSNVKNKQSKASKLRSRFSIFFSFAQLV